MPRRYTKKSQTNTRTYKIAKKAALQVVKQQSETKTHVYDGTSGVTSANSLSANNLLYFFNIAQGDTQQTRDGNQIRVTSTAWDVYITLNQDYFAATPVNYPVYCRLVEYTPIEDQQDNLSFTNGYDQVDLDRYRVHSDVVQVMTENKPYFHWKKTKYYKRPMVVQWIDGTGGSVAKNNRKLHFIMYDEIGGITRLPITGGTAMVNIVWQHRTKYKDF